jgi:hypothetical protein
MCRLGVVGEEKVGAYVCILYLSMCSVEVLGVMDCCRASFAINMVFHIILTSIEQTPVSVARDLYDIFDLIKLCAAPKV